MTSGRSTPSQSPDDPPSIQGHYRRAPRFPVFIGLGVVVGIIVAVLLTYSQPPSSGYTYSQVLGYTAVAGGLIGGLLGGLVAVLLDWRR